MSEKDETRGGKGVSANSEEARTSRGNLYDRRRRGRGGHKAIRRKPAK